MSACLDWEKIKMEGECNNNQTALFSPPDPRNAAATIVYYLW
jgi:hypothetical protein